MRISLRQYWHLLAIYLKPQWPRVLVMLGLLFGQIGMELFNPQVLRQFLDVVLTHGPFTTLMNYGLWFIAIAFAIQFTAILTTYVSEQLRWATTNPLRIDLARHCLQLDMSFHHTHTPGEMIERLDGDVNALSTFFSQFVIDLLGGLLLLVGILLLLFREDWHVGLIFSLFSLIVLAILLAFRHKASDAWEKERQASADLYGFIEENLAAQIDLRTNGAQSYVMHRLYHNIRSLYQKGTRAYMYGSYIWWLIINPLFLGANIGVLAIGAYLYQAGTIPVSTVFLFFAYVQMLRGPLDRIANQLRELQRAGASIRRIQELYTFPISIQDGTSIALANHAMTISFENVAFAYQEREPLFSNLTFNVRAGHVLGLLGRTGSGKTTIMRLLCRLYDVAAGSITLDGLDIRDTTIAELRHRIGVVTQDVQIFQASLRDNLALFDRDIADEQMLQVLQDLGLERWYRTLPDGLDTLLAVGGRELSAGEAQLVAFARVFLRDPGIVILDEASSRLDPATEMLIESAIDRLLQNRTGIIIAHRLGTIHRADEILILDQGTIREYGPRAQLIQDEHSYFVQLLKTGLEEILV